ncbi:MAG TPA: hypothetical protein VN723_10415 [Rhizomicrobium sp.]|nr:hypothetical protein [Rhizomicrobium sp.]
MRGFPAKQGLKPGLLLACVLTAGLAACSDIDNMFDSNSDISASDAAQPTAASMAGGAGAPPTAEAPPPMASGGGAPVATITPVAIDPGNDTGTQVNKTIQTLRGQVSGLETKLAANAQRLADLRNNGAAAAGAYQESKARITTRLQVGTTKGNPELVSEWNSAQTSLDTLSANINQLNALGTDVTNDSSSAHFALNQIGATFNVSGAVDEDHRQLSLLEDETNQTIVLIDRLLKEVSDDIQRQTAYSANERSNLTVLASSIKNGELYGGTPGLTAAAATSNLQFAANGTPLVVVRFDRPNVDYQQVLYAALNQALQARPNANFQVVAVSPTRGNAASVQIAQTTARRHAQEIMRSMTDMGVPASRMNVASSTDPNAAASEVRVFVR